MAGLEIAAFKMLHAKLARQAVGLALEQGNGVATGICGGGDAAIDAEWQGRQRMTEEPALDLGQRQHGNDLAIALGKQEERTVTKHRAHDLLPGRQVKEGGLRAGTHEGVPARGMFRRE